MSVTKLQAVHDEVIADGIGVYLPVVQRLLAAIREHIAEDTATSTQPSTTETQSTSH